MTKRKARKMFVRARRVADGYDILHKCRYEPACPDRNCGEIGGSSGLSSAVWLIGTELYGDMWHLTAASMLLDGCPAEYLP